MAQASVYKGLLPRFAEQQAQSERRLADKMAAMQFGQQLATAEIMRREKLQENSKRLREITQWLPFAPPEEQGQLLDEVGKITGIDFSGAKPDEVMEEFKKLDQMAKQGGPQLVRKGLEVLRQKYGLNPLYKDMILRKERSLAAQQGPEAMQRQAYIETGAPPAVSSGKEREFAPDVETWINPETGEAIPVNVRDEAERDRLFNEGYRPISPEMRGYGVERGKLAAQSEKVIIDDANKATSQIATLNTLEGLLDRMETGRLANWRKSIQQIANSFDIPIDTANLAAKEAFTALTNELALRSRNLGQGMVLAGQMSDQDVKFLQDMNPQLILSKAGNKLLIKIRKKLAERQAQVVKLLYEFKKKNRGIFDPLKFRIYTEERLGKDPVFGIPNGAVKVGVSKKTGLPIYKYKGKYYQPEI